MLFSRTLLQRLLACPSLALGIEDLLSWYKRKKWYQCAMAAVQTIEKHGNEIGFTLSDMHQFKPVLKI